MRALEDFEDEDGMEEAADDGDAISSAQLLNILREQRSNSIGFDNDKEISGERARALDYYKAEHAGAVAKDLPVLENRSRVVSSDVADAVETALPDLIEVIAGADDSITFQPANQEDEKSAEQETDYVRHVIFQQNRGWQLFYDAFKDALICKTGVFHFCWDGETEYQEAETIATEAQIEELAQMGVEIVSVEPTGTMAPFGGMTAPLMKVTTRKVCKEGHVAISVVAPEDFTVAPETVLLSETNYCAMRTRDTVQNLIAQGYDEDKVRSLTTDEVSEGERQSRDTLEETDQGENASQGDLRLVDIVVHYIRLDIEGSGKPQIWRVVTGNGENVELEREKRARIEFAAITPYPMPHRFYGQSLADKTIGIQAWKTSLTRALNDSAYYANNQRQEVSEAELVPGVTLEALVDNQPGKPVVTKTGMGLRPIQSGNPGFDLLAALEYINTVAEQRTGVVRNAQGLNPDTLHDTKGGAEILIGAAQKRIRMMARMFAETGLRDLFVGVHDLLRSNATMKDTIRLRNKWVEIDPSSWGRRKDVVIDIGVGSGGKERDLAGIREFSEKVIAPLVQVQGGLNGPLVSKENIYALSDKYGSRLGLKGVERFITDPAQLAEMEAKAKAERQARGEPEPQPPPSPEEQKVKGELELRAKEHADTMQLEQAKLSAKAQADQQSAGMKAQQDQIQSERDFQLRQMQIAADERAKMAAAEREMELRRYQIDRELALKREQLQAELTMNFRIEEMKIAAGVYAPKPNVGGTSEVNIGGEAGA